MDIDAPFDESWDREKLTAEARAAREVRREVGKLRRDVERLFLITEALWRLVGEKLELTDAQLAQRIMDIDLEDGRLNGKKGETPARKCPHCQRKLVKHRPLCFYCGKPVELQPFER
jgi:hypothetical protein